MLTFLIQTFRRLRGKTEPKPSMVKKTPDCGECEFCFYNHAGNLPFDQTCECRQLPEQPGKSEH